MKKTISDCPELLKEWHSTLNNNLNPINITTGSNKKCWWICDKRHEWEVSPNNKRGCPYCTNKKVCKDNCLAATHPEIAKEFHPTKNKNLTYNNIIAGSHKPHWWLCSKGHEWKISPNARTNKKSNCPYCLNQKACKDNCLAILFPEIAKEFHPTLNGNTTPYDIIAGSHKKIWWICNKGHEWKVSCVSRSGNNKNGCPCCSNHKVCKDNCLATLFPEIAKEFHPTLNGNITPYNVVAGSHKKIWWICNKGHEWKTICCSRTGKIKTSCPTCNESKGEKEVVRILKKLNITYKREFKFNNCKNIRTLPFDFIIKVNNIAKIIEYHGGQHYEPCDFGNKKICKYKNFKKIQHRDEIKKDFCKSRGIPFLEISYKDYDNIEEIIKSFLPND